MALGTLRWLLGKGEFFEWTPDGKPLRMVGLNIDINGGSAHRLRFFVVDDNEPAAEMLVLLVEALGHEVRKAGDGRAAISEAAAFRPDLILMDVSMPGMNGLDAARHIRRQPWGSKVKLVALTGWGQDEDRRRTREAGFDDHLVKPVGSSELRTLFANGA